MKLIYWIHINEKMNRGIKHNTHPGEILREEVVKANDLTILRASELLKITRPTLSNILNGKAAITPNMAIRIARVFGGSPDIWVRLQTSYELREAEKDFENHPIELKRYESA
ncbi:MAG: HigA family addiction module antitoxin [Anditalea sp.]